MQKFKSNITATNGAAIRNVPVAVLTEDGALASIFLDRAGAVPAPNPLTTDSQGAFYFYAVNGRYSLRTTVEGVTITDDDVVLMNDPEEIATAGPIAEAVAAAEAAAKRAEDAVQDSGIPELVAAAQNAVVDANNAVTQAQSAAALAGSAKNDAAAANDAAQAALSSAQSAAAQANSAGQDAQAAAAAAAQSAASIDTAYLRNRANHTGTQQISTISGLQTALDSKVQTEAGKSLMSDAEHTKLGGIDSGASNDRSKHTGAVNWPWAAYGGTANAITLTPAFARAAYASGDQFRFRATATNTGAATINVGGLGVKSAVTVTGAALPAGYIRTDVDTVCVYDGTRFVVQREAEVGSNANGEYKKFGDGTMICTHKIAGISPVNPSSVTNIFRSNSITWAFPAMFASPPSVGHGEASGIGLCWTSLGAAATSAMNTSVALYSMSQAGSATVCFTAVGVWF
ncbi:hypothetical protein [Comamonas testosteroni]|uniref:hypothetical protein n=1 Tax=Comamonas testosteroni TaxID=285 RepID=UPI0006B9EE1D|nr:hypothetical protein [Comamonas testosteroni]